MVARGKVRRKRFCLMGPQFLTGIIKKLQEYVEVVAI